MLNWLDPSFSAVSLALQVTIVVPTGNLSPDVTTLPGPTSHTMVEGGMGPSTVSLADGNGDHVTMASVIPGSTFMAGTLFGEYTIGASLSAFQKLS